MSAKAVSLGWFLCAALVSVASANGFADECRHLQNGIRTSNTGDVLIHGALYQSIIKNPERFMALWSKMIPTLRDADLTIGNLEGPIAPGVNGDGQRVKDPGFVYDGKVYSGSNFSFDYHPFLLKDLLSSGFGLVTTANNHAMDRGSLGAEETVEQLDAAGLPFIGTRAQGSSEPRERVMDVKGAKFGFVACTQMTNGIADPKKQVLLCDSNEVVDSIRRLKSQTDAVIVLPHWGEEYETKPNSYQKTKARQWVDAGAKMIVGNHPHVVQTMEWIKRPDGGKALVVYSLGNFVAAQAAMERRVSAVIHVDWMIESSGAEIAQFSYTPFVRHSGSLTLSLAGPTSDEARYMEKQLGPAMCE